MSSHRPLFTLQQHSSFNSKKHKHDEITKSNEGSNGVTCLTFLHNGRNTYNEEGHRGDDEHVHDDDNLSDRGNGDDTDEDDDDDDDIPIFQCRSRLMDHTQRQKQQLLGPCYPAQHDGDMSLVRTRTKALTSTSIISSSTPAAIDQATALTFSNHKTFLASCHANGEAFIWDLFKRRVAFPLIDGCTRGPGLAVARLDSGCSSIDNNRDALLLYQTRDSKGTITFHKMSSSMDGCSVEDQIQCHSRSFCQATCYNSGISSDHINLIATPSKHESIVSLWDRRMNNKGSDGSTSRTIRPSVGLIHGAGLDLKYDSDSSNWRKEGMVMSLKLCDWGTVRGADLNIGGYGNSSIVLGCGMESGKVFIHDLRKMNSPDGPIILNEYIDNDHNEDDNLFIPSKHFTSVNLGMNPVLTLDMLPSSDKSQATNKNDNLTKNAEGRFSSNDKYSVVTVAGTAGDANDQLDLSEEERGTVSVIKATMAMKNNTDSVTTTDDKMNDPVANKRINARIRAKVGTCKISEDSSFLGKPGVGICRFRPDGSCFAVGGWDKRIRIYSRTTAKLLAILRGTNEEAITTLDWAVGDDDLLHAGVLAAGSSDGKISLWRT